MTFRPGGNIGWSINNELDFISRLGTLSKSTASRRRLLNNYLISCENRHNWGFMDRKKVVAYAKQQLTIEPWS